MITLLQIRSYFTTIRNFTKLQEIAEFSNGKKLLLETGNFAKLADGSAVASVGNTSVLVTSVSKIRPGAPPSFMPLTVDYRQKYAAAGRIPSNYLRRELAPTEKEILTSRVVDRSIRPLFPSDYLHDTQLSCQLLAVDGFQEPDVVSINAASASLAVSNIPWNGPVGAVRLGVIDGRVVVFPTRKEIPKSDLNLILTASEKGHVVMLEGGGSPVKINDLKATIEFGIEECKKIIHSINLLAKAKGREKREYSPPPALPDQILEAVRSLSSVRVREIFTDFSHDKLSRDNAVNALRLDVVQKLSESFNDGDANHFNEAFNKICKEVFRELILEENIRCDGRGLTDLRPITCSVDLFKPLHGSSIFQRGQTQVQCTVAYDSPDKAVKVDPLLEITGGVSDKNFLLHYSFPAFANNEVSRAGPVSRREIGHGALAAKGLKPLLPKDIPFCVLLTSTVLESNGSSSMATVCGGSLALMDAGVALPCHVAGVAIGLVSRVNLNGEIVKYKIVTDILGIEDYMGDMDFKMAGTEEGITAIQADIKLPGIPIDVVIDSIDAGIEAKKSILRIMSQTIAEPRRSKENLPLVVSKEVPLNRRGALMVGGGMKLRRIQAETGVQITWEDNNTLSLFATNKEIMDEALQLIEENLKTEPELEFGAVYSAKITEIRPQGVMVALYDGMIPVLLHNSQLDVKKINHPSVLNLEEGDEIKVKYFGRDPSSGHMRISRRAILSTTPIGSKNLIRKESENS